MGAFYGECVVSHGGLYFSLSNTNNVLAMGDMWRAWYFHLGRWREPPYLADMYLVSPW